MTIVTDGELIQLVKDHKSYSDILRTLDREAFGSAHANISRRIKRLELDTSHFDGTTTSGRRNNNGAKKMSAEAILVLDDSLSIRRTASLLRRAMLEHGVSHVCALCNTKNEWNGQPLVLQIDHINGSWRDNRVENLRFLCPNCHTQLSTSTPIYRGKYREQTLCADCQSPCSHGRQRCMTCSLISKHKNGLMYKIIWPEPKALQQMIDESSREAAGRLLGVSGNSIKKHMQNYPISTMRP